MELKMNEIILRVLNGESSPEDDMQLMKWISENESNLQSFKETEKIWNAVDIVLNRHRFSSEKAFSDFRFDIKTFRYKNQHYESVGVKNLFVTTIRRAAIVIMLLSFGGLLGYLGLRYVGSDEALNEVVVPNGARSNIKLPDGTSVWLNADSKLQYAQNFNKSKRIVYLTGEGYFEVESNVNKPFVVKTSEIEITALGTIFNVKSYPDEELVQTTLVEGLVIVNKESDTKKTHSIVLEPDQQAVYYKVSGDISAIKQSEKQVSVAAQIPDQTSSIPVSNKIVLKKQIDTKAVTAWKDNSLIFSDEPFRSIAVKLERRFGVNIIFNDEEVMTFRFSGRFDNISIEQALGALKYASPMFNYTIDKDKIYITRK